MRNYNTHCRNRNEPCAFYFHIGKQCGYDGYDEVKRNRNPVAADIYVAHGHIVLHRLYTTCQQDKNTYQRNNKVKRRGYVRRKGKTYMRPLGI